MPFDDVDDALRRQPMWDPPAGFSRRVAATAVRLLEPSDAVTAATVLATAWHTARGLLARGRATVGGCGWMLRQYWAILAR